MVVLLYDEIYRYEQFGPAKKRKRNRYIPPNFFLQILAELESLIYFYIFFLFKIANFQFIQMLGILK